MVIITHYTRQKGQLTSDLITSRSGNASTITAWSGKLSSQNLETYIVETTPVDVKAVSTSKVSAEFAELVYKLKSEYAWVLDELAKR